MRYVTRSSSPTLRGALGRALAADAVYFGGERAKRLNDGRRPRLHGPDPSHVHGPTYRRSPTNDLMTPKLTAGKADHFPGVIVLGVMEDVGWRVAPGVVEGLD